MKIASSRRKRGEVNASRPSTAPRSAKCLPLQTHGGLFLDGAIRTRHSEETTVKDENSVVQYRSAALNLRHCCQYTVHTQSIQLIGGPLPLKWAAANPAKPNATNPTRIEKYIHPSPAFRRSPSSPPSLPECSPSPLARAAASSTCRRPGAGVVPADIRLNMPPQRLRRAA